MKWVEIRGHRGHLLKAYLQTRIKEPIKCEEDGNQVGELEWLSSLIVIPMNCLANCSSLMPANNSFCSFILLMTSFWGAWRKLSPHCKLIVN